MMAGRGMTSSESDDYCAPRPLSRGGYYMEGSVDDKLEKLTSNLHETTKNLRTLDQMLGTYKDVGEEQRSAIDKLRANLDETVEEIQEEKYRASHLERSPGHRQKSYKDVVSDLDSPSGHSRKRKSSVRFADDMNRELHDLHQTVRDISSDQTRLKETLNQEIGGRDRHDLDARRYHSEATRQPIIHPDTVSLRVEKRLQAIQNEIRADRQLLFDKNQAESLNALSAELKQALQQQQQQLVSQLAAAQPAPTPTPERDDSIYKSQYLHSEAQKYKAEAELESMRRKLDQTEGSKLTLQQQVDELRNNLVKAEQERARLKMWLEEQRMEVENKERQKRRTAEEVKGRERTRLESELQDLRQHLSQSVGIVGDMDSLRRNMEKSEQQRKQLSDHIETLSKDLDNKERQAARLITQLQDVVDKYEASDRNRKSIESHLEDTLARLKDTSKDLEKTNRELELTKQALTDSERKKDVFKGKAQEAVRQWKAKVKQLERELHCQKHGSGQMMQRNEELVKEMEVVRIQTNGMNMKWDTLKRELSDALAIRAAQDEQLRLKDIEVNELKSMRMDLQKDLRDSQSMMEKLENEHHLYESRFAAATEEKSRLKGRLASVEGSQVSALNKAQQLELEVQELSRLKNDLADQFSDVSSQKQNLHRALVDAEQRNNTLKQECELFQNELKQSKERFQATLESVKQELNEVRVREAHGIQEASRRFKKEQAEYEAAIQVLKLELSEERSSLKLARRQDEQQKSEVDRFQRDVTRLEEENSKLMRKLERTRQHFVTKDYQTKTDISRMKQLEDQLYDAHSKLKRIEQDHLAVLQNIFSEVDSMIEIAAIGHTDKYEVMNAVRSNVDDPCHLIAEIKSKLRWLQSEMAEKIWSEKQLRRENKDMLFTSDSDHCTLLAEQVKKDAALGDLAALKEEFLKKERDKAATSKAETDVLPFSDHHIRTSPGRQHIIDEMETEDKPEEAKTERDKIEERYLRLQETVKSLQKELDRTQMSSQHFLHENDRVTSLLPSDRRKVWFTESPNRSRSPPSRLTSTAEQSLPPLSLTDEEFNREFLPSDDIEDGS